MKYTCKLVINLPRERVVEFFDDPDNLVQWMEGLQSFEHVSGTPGRPGAKSRLTFARDNGETFDMIETLTRYNLPDEISGTYETDGVRNVIENWFVEDGPNATSMGGRQHLRVRRLHAHRVVVHAAAVQTPFAQGHARVQGLCREHRPGLRGHFGRRRVGTSAGHRGQNAVSGIHAAHSVDRPAVEFPVGGSTVVGGR